MRAAAIISRGLVEIYAHIQTRLIEANSRQIDPPLAEVEQLLGVLQEAWRGGARRGLDTGLRRADARIRSCKLRRLIVSWRRATLVLFSAPVPATL